MKLFELMESSGYDPGAHIQFNNEVILYGMAVGIPLMILWHGGRWLWRKHKKTQRLKQYKSCTKEQLLRR